jgi:hypothetical protein
MSDTTIERDRLGGEVRTFRACALEMASGRLALVEYHIGGGRYFMPAFDSCPVHNGRGCLETYYSAPFVASWPLAGWWRLRRTIRRRIGGTR